MKDFISIVPSHHRTLPEEYDDKPKESHRSRSPTRGPRDRSEHSEPRRSTGELCSISPLNKTRSYKSALSTCVLWGLSSTQECVFILFVAAKEEKPESKDLLADLQDISDSERKTSTAESSMGNEGTW